MTTAIGTDETLTVSIPGHPAACLCTHCMTADMNAHLATMGLDPARYADGNGEHVGTVRTRYATPGQRAGNGYVRLLSDKQVRFIRHLLATRDTRALVRLPGSEDVEAMSLAGARDLIDRLLACPERPGVIDRPSDKQLAYLASLLAERVTDAVVDLETVTRREASRLIDGLVRAPRKPCQTGRTARASAQVEDGVYLVDGKVIKVQRAVHGSGNRYAKILNPKTGRFDYAPGIVRTLRPEQRMTLEQAIEYGALYGVCARCGRTLTRETSIEAGIGPVCAGKF